MSRTGQSCRHSSNHPTETHHILGVAKKQVLPGQILSRLRHSNRKWASWSRVLVGILCFLDAAFVQRVRDCKRGCDHKKEANRNIENKPGSPFLSCLQCPRLVLRQRVARQMKRSLQVLRHQLFLGNPDALLAHSPYPSLCSAHTC